MNGASKEIFPGLYTYSDNLKPSERDIEIHAGLNDDLSNADAIRDSRPMTQVFGSSSNEYIRYAHILPDGQDKSDPDRPKVVFWNTFAGGYDGLLPTYVYAEAMRRHTNPEAEMIVLPCDAFREEAVRLSREERATVYRGDLSPYHDREARLLEKFGKAGVTGIGVSNGAARLSSLGGSTAGGNIEFQAAVMSVPANIIDRTRIQIIKDFFKESAQYKAELDRMELPVITELEYLEPGTLNKLNAGRMLFRLGVTTLLNSSNRAQLRSLCVPTFEPILRGFASNNPNTPVAVIAASKDPISHADKLSSIVKRVSEFHSNVGLQEIEGWHSAGRSPYVNGKVAALALRRHQALEQ